MRSPLYQCMTAKDITDIARSYLNELEWVAVNLPVDAPFEENQITVDDVAQICFRINEQFGVRPDPERWEYYPNSILDLQSLYLHRERWKDPWEGRKVECVHITEPYRKKKWWQRLLKR